ncbi:MAG: DUF805 domain-containing protein [Oscillospiraceae bacterium]|nr:DUF805 domain-containing protein [Oscillospiraceae bacterium]
MKEYIAMWQNFANFRDTATVRDYWMAWLINFLIGLAIGVVSGLLPALTFVSTLYSLAATIPGLALSVRRLNDAGYSWKSLLWGFCPLVGWIIVLVRLCKKSAY